MDSAVRVSTGPSPHARDVHLPEESPSADALGQDIRRGLVGTSLPPWITHLIAWPRVRYRTII